MVRATNMAIRTLLKVIKTLSMIIRTLLMVIITPLMVVTIRLIVINTWPLQCPQQHVISVPVIVRATNNRSVSSNRYV
jgi:hypothetical protein